MTLEEVKLRYVRYVLYQNKGKRTETAKQLGISVRSIRNQIRKMKEIGIIETNIEETLTDARGFNDFYFKLPTNEERLSHLDNPRYKSRTNQ